ncbi:hypothetical protein KKE33_02600, partial [Patescibacteria group bacterium]|nr:hypothetical protein [Patescibacteria group bacterium]
MGAEGKNPEDAEYPRRHSETQRHDLGLPSVLRTGSEATQGRPVGRPIIKPKLEPTTEPAQVTKIDPVQRPKVVDLEGMTPLSRMSRVREATEQRISNLKKAHADEIASLKAELLRAKRAQKEEQQAHQVTKQRLAET